MYVAYGVFDKSGFMSKKSRKVEKPHKGFTILESITLTCE